MIATCHPELVEGHPELACVELDETKGALRQAQCDFTYTKEIAIKKIFDQLSVTRLKSYLRLNPERHFDKLSVTTITRRYFLVTLSLSKDTLSLMTTIHDDISVSH